ncbi:MAG TPA: 6-bladed beta-propeller [Gemmatimonadales bacterium]
MVLAPACAATDEPPSTTVSDSAGVRIVSNRAADERDPIWLVADRPSVDIGRADQSPEYELFRASHSLRLTDGRIVVANGGTNQVRFYEHDGTFVGAVGREGEGPGEFRGLEHVFPYRGDSILVSDFRLARLSVFDSDGRFGRSVTTQTTQAAPFVRVVGVFEDYTLLGTGGIDVGNAPPSGLRRYPIRLYHLDSAAVPLDSLGAFPSTEMFFLAFGGGISTRQPLFGKASRWFAGGNQFYVATNDTYEIRRYGLDGTVHGIVRLDREPRPVTDGDVQRELDRRLAAAGTQDRAEVERTFRTIPRPETMPAYGRVLLDDSLHLWVGDYPLQTDSLWFWRVFDPSGTYLGRVVMPVGLEPHQIGHDFVLGRWFDPDGVEHVRLYHLERAGAI